jgi:hypothetical protein
VSFKLNYYSPMPRRRVDLKEFIDAAQRWRAARPQPG